MKLVELHIYGLVQGVGFRPFVYRVAKSMNLCGEVHNDSSGIVIRLNNTPSLHDFVDRIKNEAPSISHIVDVNIRQIEGIRLYDDFTITPSNSVEGYTQVSPDIGICQKCLDEFRNPSRRQGYPFVNCTYCGPRFSIISSLPYDRYNTTMSHFTMCKDCHSEYINPLDRRFHAQPIACAKCGPHYSYHGTLKDGNITRKIIRHLENGDILMLKGLGGYNLLCDANNVEAVRQLRILKSRPRKAFAVMVPSLSVAKKYIKPFAKDIELLLSWRKPIVVCEKLNMQALPEVAPRFRTLGVMLPYMAIHYDIFDNSTLEAIIVTSANHNGSPMLIGDDEAMNYANLHYLPIVSYNRIIHNRVDDSVVSSHGSHTMIFRRGRGYAPEPLFINKRCDGILAMGAEIVPHFALGIQDTIVLSQYIGDINELANEQFYREALSRYCNIFNFQPRIIAVDAHPMYRTTNIGLEIAKERNIPVVKVWHHHAHAVAVMAEYGLTDDVLALCLDGTGYGNDGNIWGGEILRCNTTDFNRLWHLPYLNMPGGDAAAREGWRMAVALLMKTFGNTSMLPQRFIERVGENNIRAVENMIITSTNSPLSSGAGRIFDAVAALLGISYENTYESESPMLLEQIADSSVQECYSISDGYATIIDGLLNDIRQQVPQPTIAAKFHNTFALLLTNEILRLSQEQNLNKIILSGGVLQNKLLLNRILQPLSKRGLSTYFPSKAPCNDANIPIGQIIIASNPIGIS